MFELHLITVKQIMRKLVSQLLDYFYFLFRGDFLLSIFMLRLHLITLKRIMRKLVN